MAEAQQTIGVFDKLKQTIEVRFGSGRPEEVKKPLVVKNSEASALNGLTCKMQEIYEKTRASVSEIIDDFFGSSRDARQKLSKFVKRKKVDPDIAHLILTYKVPPPIRNC